MPGARGRGRWRHYWAPNTPSDPQPRARQTRQEGGPDHWVAKRAAIAAQKDQGAGEAPFKHLERRVRLGLDLVGGQGGPRGAVTQQD